MSMASSFLFWADLTADLTAAVAADLAACPSAANATAHAEVHAADLAAPHAGDRSAANATAHADIHAADLSPTAAADHAASTCSPLALPSSHRSLVFTASQQRASTQRPAFSSALSACAAHQQAKRCRTSVASAIHRQVRSEAQALSPSSTIFPASRTRHTTGPGAYFRASIAVLLACRPEKQGSRSRSTVRV